MAKTNPNASLLIDDYIENSPSFSKDICKLIRELIQTTEYNVIEDWKWNAPIFKINDMVCGFFGFKNHVSLTFFNGAKMNDQFKLFSDDCSAKNNRTIKFTHISEVNKTQLLEYFKEAFLLNEMGIKKIDTPNEIKIPESLQIELNKNELAKSNFENMAYTYRKEYAIYISEAKRETTKLKRLEKVIFNLEKNIKIHEQYKC
jgi:uncharacterized protein YdeI (YjbR/CyaY-like superfamily)